MFVIRLLLSLGQYLVSNILSSKDLELAFVWNRSQDVVKKSLDSSYILDSLSDISNKDVDLVVEVAHPDISSQYAPQILQHADYMVGSPGALANKQFEATLKQSVTNHTLYIPCGALWGSEDIRKMADCQTLEKLSITMSLHPEGFRLPPGELYEKNQQVNERTVLYHGPVRQVCQLAPNNVNTMAAAAIAGHTLGFDGTIGTLISDPSLDGWHVIEVNVETVPLTNSGDRLQCHTIRRNPVQTGRVTGVATCQSFFASLLRARDKSPGIHLC